MHNLNIKYWIFSTLIFCVLSSTNSVAQAIVTDTVITIKTLQKNAERNMETQDFVKAIHQLNTANKLAMSPNYTNYRKEITLYTAQLFYHLQYFEKADQETLKAISHLTDSNDTFDLAKAYNLYGLIQISKKDYKTAQEYISKADTLFSKLDDPQLKYHSVYAMGRLELSRGNFEAAVSYFKKAIPPFKAGGSAFLESSSYSSMADALSLIDISKYPSALKEAEEALNTSLEIATTNNFLKILLEKHRILSQIYIADNKPLLAEKELHTYLNKKDSLNQKNLNAIEEGIQAESSVSNYIEIIASQKDDLSKQEKSLFFGKLTGWLSIALILILSLLTLSLYKNNNLRAKANELLKDKNTELQQAKEKAEKASQAKAQFLSTITHELRTPMYTVTGLTHLLLEENPKPEQKEHLNSLKFSGEYLLSLINNILDLNKLEANKVEIEKAPFNLKKRIEGVLIALKKSVETKNNKMNFEYDPNLPEEVLGDSLKISQILINLISNSIKFTENGEIWVRIQGKEKIGNKIGVLFEIEDTGDGISKKKQLSIFESFSQGSLQINRKYGGTGLGLSIVKNLLELMGSKIYLESKLGEGSKFWFTINYEFSENITQETNVNQLEVIVDNDILENKSVLIVEDNKINQMITKKILEKKKMVCTVTDNGLDAIKLTKQHQYNVILMDIHMPGISGIDATKKIREFDSKVPIIALTAVTIEENLEDFYKAGFNEFIPKPFNAEDFFEKINRVLRGVDFFQN